MSKRWNSQNPEENESEAFPRVQTAQKADLGSGGLPQGAVTMEVRDAGLELGQEMTLSP